MSLLNVNRLSLRIGGSPILRDVSFDMAQGEIVAITGESGSGKSMTALSVMGLLPEGGQATGGITLMGEALLGAPDKQMCKLRGNRLGMVFQEPMTALNPVQTIGAQVAEAVYLHRPGHDADQTARDTLTRVGLPPEDVPHSRFPHQLSGGQRQRVVIAIAIACGPRLLIADEPTTALDVTTQAQILDLLRRLAREDRMGLLMITHDLAVVADMADRILVMKDGRIVETGDTHDVLRHRRHPYTQSLFAASGHRVTLPDTASDKVLLSVESATRIYPRSGGRLWPGKKPAPAVKEVTFSIKQGEHVGLVGESGCGKSTLTRAILGLEKLQRGRIRLKGQPVHGRRRAAREARRRMQVVFQDPFGSFNPRHKVGRLITEPFHQLLKPPKGSERADLIAETLTEVGLKPEDAQKYPHQFSGGQRQRIAIARALITRPELVIFDEAVSALDVSVRARILDLIASLCKSHNLTYLFISHDLSVVRSVTERVLVMCAGEIVEEGPTEQVFDRPHHLYTRALIDAAPRLPNYVNEPAALLDLPRQDGNDQD